MNDRKYLLSLTELLEGTSEQSAEQLRELACAKLDGERLRKLESIKLERKRAECIGAGLLLQLGLQEWGKGNECENGEWASGSLTTMPQRNHLHCLTVSQVLARLKEPIEQEYTYSEKGKPYFKNRALHFNLSHSGEYVFCVFSGQEVGADIQYRKPGAGERIASRFFTEAEQKAWKCCDSSEEQEDLFYKIWTRKEAYGKLTGEGFLGASSVNVLGDSSEKMRDRNLSEDSEEPIPIGTSDLLWEEDGSIENYQIAVCKYAEKKE